MRHLLAKQTPMQRPIPTKGDRYVGYNYATRRPLEEFTLEAPSEEWQMGGERALVSSLPVVGILGRQHQVDGVYHDFSTDLVYIFSAQKFYTFKASEFKVSREFVLPNPTFST